MKKFSIFMLFFICIAIFFIPCGITAYANSAQMKYNTQSERFELLAVKDSEISVNNEHLLFDFGKNKINDTYKYPLGEVTATYDMRNAGEDKTVMMGFPFTTTIENLRKEKAQINMNGENIDFTKYYVFIEPNVITNLTFEEILEGINSQETIDENLLGKIYIFNFGISDNSINAQVEFDVNFSQTTIIRKNFNGYGISSTSSTTCHVKLTSWIGANAENRTAYLYVFGEDINNIEVKSIDQNQKETPYYKYTIDTSDIVIKDYINTLYENMDEQEYKTALVKFSEFFQSGEEYINEEYEIINDVFQTNCVALLGYTTTLKGNSESNILKVSYSIEGGYNAYYEPTLYLYNYISSPAKNWASFGKLTVEIKTCESVPFVIKSNLEFMQKGNNTYIYEGEGIPTGNIEFGLCASENPKYNPRKNQRTVFLIIIFYVFIGLIIIGITVSLGILIGVWIKKAKSKKELIKENGENNTKGN